MYAVISTPLVSRTRATLRRAEFGFFGVFVYTRVQTPRRWGAPFRAGVFPLVGLSWRPLRTSCWIVGTNEPLDCSWRDGPNDIRCWAGYPCYGRLPICSNIAGRHPSGRFP